MNRNAALASLLRVLKKNVLFILILIFAIAGVVVISLIPPQLLRYIIDNNLIPKSYEGLLKFAVLYIVVLLFIGLFDFLKEGLLTIFGQKITTEIRLLMVKKLEVIGAEYFSQNETGVILSRFTNDVEALNQLFTSGIVGMIIDLFKIIGIVVSIWLFSLKLGLIVLGIIPIIFLITRVFQKNMFVAQLKNRVLVGKVNNHISESLKNLQMIKSFSKEKYMEDKYVAYLMDNYQTIEKVNFYDSIFSPAIQLTRSVVIATIVILCSNQLNFLGISLGMIAASIELISNLFAPVENLGMEIQNLQQAIAGVSRVNEFCRLSEDRAKKLDLKAEEILASKEINLCFNSLSFHYEEGKDILNNIELKINKGEKLTFIGRTGVGKSTLFKLVLGLLKPTQGNITLNGIDVFEISNYEKRRIFGYVDQSFPIINGTIAEQISLRDDSITREQITRALDFVGLTDYVASMDLGLDTYIENDKMFSQGQKQLLSIARAIVVNPPILLLDEITSNLDSLTEDKITSVLQKASNEHTILSISHRLSSMFASDRIVILEEGRIKSTGTPEELQTMDEWYKTHIALEKLTWN